MLDNEKALPMPSGSAGRQSSDSTNSTGSKPWSAETERLVVALFHRLTTLYRNRSKDFAILDADENLTFEFRTWCEKLAHLTEQQFRQGVELLERQEAEARRIGDETWPPSYAGFIGLATMSTKPRSTVTELPAVMGREEANKRLAEIMKAIQ